MRRVECVLCAGIGRRTTFDRVTISGMAVPIAETVVCEWCDGKGWYEVKTEKVTEESE